MTDHAAEAQRILRELQTARYPKDATALTLEAIAHTLQAILQRLPAPATATTVAPDRCGTTRSAEEWGPDGSGLAANDYPCTQPAGHTDRHRDTDGDGWA